MSRAVETAFLPAALEVEETPPAAAGRAILWTIAVFFGLAVAWAGLGEVDIVTVARGRIIPSGHSKTVQPLEIGTVAAIHVVEGQAVMAGEPLIELDRTGVLADLERLTGESESARLEVRRLQRLAEWLARTVPPDATELASAGDALLLQRWREFEDRVAVLRHEGDRALAGRRSARRRVAKLEAILPIVAGRARNQKELAEQKLLPEQQYLESELERLAIHHDLRSGQGRVEELDADIEALDARRVLLRSEFRRQVLERLAQSELRVSALAQERVKAATRARALTLRAPVDGIVQQLSVHHVGAVVTPAQSVLVIVPRGEVLEVEATLENKDVGFVEPGQEVEIKVDTFPFTKYGTAGGEVLDLSHDAVADERMGLVYRLRVRMDRSELAAGGRPVRLGPGMTVTVEIRTGTRRLLEYFLSPLLRYADESMRER